MHFDSQLSGISSHDDDNDKQDRAGCESTIWQAQSHVSCWLSCNNLARRDDIGEEDCNETTIAVLGSMNPLIMRNISNLSSLNLSIFFINICRPLTL